MWYKLIRQCKIVHLVHKVLEKNQGNQKGWCHNFLPNHTFLYGQDFGKFVTLLNSFGNDATNLLFTWESREHMLNLTSTMCMICLELRGNRSMWSMWHLRFRSILRLNIVRALKPKRLVVNFMKLQSNILTRSVYW